MTPSQLEKFLIHAMKNKFPVLVKSKPGVGKSDIITEAAQTAGFDLILSHPVVSDPTDFKGLPYAKDGKADFLPFGDLEKILNATQPTVFFLDDLGQASSAVQAACMQLLLARQINGHKVSDQVTFVAATNRKEDKAAVSGVLEPVKSRFRSIVDLVVDHEDWVKWALVKGNMPTELIAFIRWKPTILDEFQPSKDIVNSVCPRTVAAVGEWQNSSLDPELFQETFSGAAGQGFATEYCAFLDIWKQLPNVDQILMTPDKVEIPTNAAVLWAIGGAIASRVTDMTVGNAFAYISRAEMPKENAMACVKDMITRKPDLTNTRAYIKWSSDIGNAIMK